MFAAAGPEWPWASARGRGVRGAGRAVKGRIASVQEDRSVAANGQHPWRIVYSFEAYGHQYEGKTQTWEAATSNRFRGSPGVVLAVECNPERNTLYPPIR